MQHRIEPLDTLVYASRSASAKTTAAVTSRLPAGAVPAQVSLPAFAQAKTLLAAEPSAAGERDIGLHRPVPQTQRSTDVATRLKWHKLPDGTQIAAIRFQSVGARGIRVPVVVEQLPAGAVLRWLSAHADDAPRQYSAQRIAHIQAANHAAGIRGLDQRTIHGPYFTGDAATLEIELPPQAHTSAVRLAVPHIAHLVYSIEQASADVRTKLDSHVGDSTPGCHINAMCREPEPARRATAKMVFDQRTTVVNGRTQKKVSICTGTLMNNTADDRTPYFATAWHCINTPESAATLQTWWFFTARSCTDSSRSLDRQYLADGADLLYSRKTLDFTLLKLREPAPAGVVFSGAWAGANDLNDSIHSFHHPAGDLQKYSRGQLSQYENCVINGEEVDCTAQADAHAPDANFIRANWSEGMSEGGSSGSSLLRSFGDPSQSYLIGVLNSGSLNAGDLTQQCGAGHPKDSSYGRFDRAYFDPDNAAIRNALSPASTPTSPPAPGNPSDPGASNPGGTDPSSPSQPGGTSPAVPNVPPSPPTTAAHPYPDRIEPLDTRALHAASAPAPKATPAAVSRSQLPAGFVPRMLELPAPLLNPSALRSASTPATAKLAHSVGFGRSVPLTGTGLASHMNWATLPDGAHVGALSVRSAGATAVRVALQVQRWPAGAQLRWLSAQGQVIHTTSAQTLAAAPQTPSALLWGPILEGDTATLEIHLPAGINPLNAQQLSLNLPRLSHFSASPTEAPTLKTLGAADGELGRAAACHINAMCDSSAAADLQRRSTVRLAYTNEHGNSYKCSATLLNNTADDRTPYLATSWGCIDAQTQADSVQTWWFWHASSCTDPTRNPAAVWIDGGAELIYASRERDFALLKLRRPAPEGAVFAGSFTGANAQYSEVATFHHPQGDLQKHSTGSIRSWAACTWGSNSAGGLSLSCPNKAEAASSHFVVRWQQGVTESMSGGAALVRTIGQRPYVIGTFSTGDATCSPRLAHETEYFARLDRAFHDSTNDAVRRSLRPQ